MTPRIFALAATAAAALSGCAHGAAVPDKELASLREQVRVLRSERDSDRRRLEALEAQLAAMARRQQEGKAPRAESPHAPSAALPPRNLDVVRLAPAPTPAPVEEDEDSFVFIVDRGDGEEQAPATSRPSRQARRAVGGPIGVDAAPPVPTDIPLRDPELGPDADDAGLAALGAGDRAGAAAPLERFLAQRPHDRRADNAVLALGEVFRQQNLPGRALQTWERVATEYPAGDAVPDALLRYGETCKKLGRSAAAEAAFRRLVQDYPGTEAAGRAGAYLAEGK